MSTFNAERGEQLKLEGMQRAADNRAALLGIARGIAEDLALRNGRVTADDVYQRLESLGYDVSMLGPAAGSLFKTRKFESSGAMVKSERTSNHRRLIHVWSLRHD